MKIRLLFLGLVAQEAFAPAAALAANRDSSAGAIPQSFQKNEVRASDLQDPGIISADDPGAPCVVNATGQDHSRARIAGVRIGDKCLPQQDAFKRAAEASSYLAIYQQYYSDFGQIWQDEKTRKRIQKSVNDCLTGGPDCNRNDLLRALVQYNFGKELKAQMVENQSRAERMKSVDLGPKGWSDLNVKPTRILSSRGSLRTGSLRKNTFRLDPREVQVLIPDKLSEAERSLLGAEFNQGFNQFVNEYTSSTGQYGPKARWHYILAKSAAVTGQQVYVAAPDDRNFDTRQGKSAVDQNRLEKDFRSQGSQVVTETIGRFRNQYRDVLETKSVEQTVRDPQNPGKTKKVPIDSMSAAYQDMGFGLPRGELAKIGKGGPEDPRDAKDVAAGVVIRINKAINDKEKDMTKGASEDRSPSSSNSSPRANIHTSVMVDVQAFDHFLNDIWPGGAPK